MHMTTFSLPTHGWCGLVEIISIILSNEKIFFFSFFNNDQFWYYAPKYSWFKDVYIHNHMYGLVEVPDINRIIKSKIDNRRVPITWISFCNVSVLVFVIINFYYMRFADRTKHKTIFYVHVGLTHVYTWSQDVCSTMIDSIYTFPLLNFEGKKFKKKKINKFPFYIYVETISTIKRIIY